MKRILIALIMLSSLTSLAAPWDLRNFRHETTKKCFEVVTIDWYTPEYYYADYWYPGQPAGYYFFLALQGVQSATWELSIDIETTINGVTAPKTFIFTVSTDHPTTIWHDHIFEMASQMSPGETIPWDADMTINHWWIIS